MKKKSVIQREGENKTAKQLERDRLFHLHHGYPPNAEEAKGVEILSRHPKPTHDPEKGVEIHDQRHG